MASLKDLQEMAKNGEVSKKLLEDDGFKNELKKALKEENGAEITDEQVSQIIKNFETALQNEGPFKESELEEISGGQISKAKVVKGISALLGAAANLGLAKRFGIKYEETESKLVKYGRHINNALIGAVTGAGLGDYICKKFDIKD